MTHSEREVISLVLTTLYFLILGMIHTHTLTDINECDREGNALLCDTNSDCTDTEGSYVCQCNHGYTGDGFTCTSK